MFLAASFTVWRKEEFRKWHLPYNYSGIDISVFSSVCFFFFVWLINPTFNLETISTVGFMQIISGLKTLVNQTNQKRLIILF